MGVGWCGAWPKRSAGRDAPRSLAVHHVPHTASQQVVHGMSELRAREGAAAARGTHAEQAAPVGAAA
eukprot:5091626-Alexandrium_andersonii.AAC.1